MKKINFERISASILFLACSFPYVSPIATPFDTQPYAIFIATAIIFTFSLLKKNIGVPKSLIPFILIFVYSVLLFLTSMNMMALRSVVGYATVAIISLASYWTFKHIKGKEFVYIVRTWFLFGIGQLLISKDFGSFMLARLSTSDSRGITSLATEPSYYSIVCIFFFVMNDLFYAREEYSKKAYNRLFLLLSIQMLFSRSGIGFMLFLIYLASRVLAQGNLKKLLKQTLIAALLVSVVLFLFTSVESLKISRLGYLISIALQNPRVLLLTDGSVADRSVHIILSHASLFYSKGLGFGLGTWADNSLDLARQIGGFPLALAQVNITEAGRIMSGWGTAVFELGFVGAIFILSYVRIMTKGIRRSSKKMKSVYISSFITIYFVMLNGIAIAFPLFGYLIGTFVYLQQKKQVAIVKDDAKLMETNAVIQ